MADRYLIVPALQATADLDAIFHEIANWVDTKVLNTIAFVRRQVDRLPPHSRDNGSGVSPRGAVAR